MTRVVVVGATGNVGTSLVEALAGSVEVDSILGIARRRPALTFNKTEWAQADIAKDDLASLFRGADAVVHLAWLIQPSRKLDELWHANVEGSSRLFRAVVDAGVGALVYASSVGTYSPGSKQSLVDERWPRDGTPTSYYARQKAEVERRLDRFEQEHPRVRVVRLRPGLIFKREAAAGIRRLFAGPFVPRPLLRAGAVPLFPDIPGLRFQAVHTLDVAEAYRAAIVGEASGAFNVAAEPVLDAKLLSQLLEARLVPVSARLARSAVSLLWRLHAVPLSPDWLDLVLNVPLLDTARVRTALGWSPQKRADDALRELMQGMRAGAGAETPPLSPRTSGPLRVRELVTGVGRRSGT